MALIEFNSEEDMSNFVSLHKYVVVCVYYKKHKVPKSFLQHLDRRYPTVKFSLIDSANLSYCSDSSNSDTPEYFLYVDGDMPDDMVTLTQRNIEKLIKDQLI